MMARNVYSLVGLLLVLFDAYDDSLGEDYEEDGSRLIRINGDVIFGGIFPMHEQVAVYRGASPCGAVKEEKGVQRLEAMLFAIDEINNDDQLLPNTTLGALILDSCSSDTYALDQCMEFVRSYMNQDMSEYRCENGTPPIYVPHKSVTGVIGASFSVVSIMVANILRLFKIPQLSYASTSTELSEKSRFEYFSRVVPPDNFQAQAMVEVIRQLGWKYVSTVAVEGDYGEKGIASFIALSSEYNICVAVSEKILRNSKPEDFDRIVERLGAKHNARGVVLFVDEDNVRKLLQAAVRANRTGHFMWVGSDSWGAKVHPVRDQEFAAEGAITILPFRNALQDFDTYYRSLRPRMGDECNGQAERNVPHPRQKGKIVNCRNLWFREFWAQHHKCSFVPNALTGMKRCTGDEELIEYDQEGLVPFVVDAVYAMAHGVHNLIEDECVNATSTSHHLCESLSPAPPGPHLLQYIRNVTFVGRQGTEIRFNADGDAFGFYNIYQYQRNEDGRFDYTLIGSWREVLSLDINMTRWSNGPGVTNIPRSTCSDNCPLGHVRTFQEPCCWSCVACPEYAYVFNDTCQSCNPGWAPDPAKIRCEKLDAKVIAWDSPWAVVPLLFASIGILSTLFTIVIFIRFNRTPVIMASGRELCYVLLFGILSCYGMSFLILSQPTKLNCTCLRIGLGLCLSICYSAILTKTNRISRIFNQGKKCVKRPSYTSPESQVAIALGITSVQLIGAIVWLIIDPPNTKEIYPYRLTAVLTCRVSTFSLMMSLVYNMILILMCTLYAFKTRKMPANFNEAKYIGFTMYSTCIVWLAFVPIYFGTLDYRIQIASMCMCINISASVALGCLLTPKVYLVLFQPEKNIRPPHPNTAGPGAGGVGAGTSTGRDGAPSQRHGAYSMRFTTPRSQTMQSVTSFSRSSPTRQSQAGSSRPVNERLADHEDRDGIVMRATNDSAVHRPDVEENDPKLTTVPELSEGPGFVDTSARTIDHDGLQRCNFLGSKEYRLNDIFDSSYQSSIESAEMDEVVPFEVIRSVSEKVTRRNITTLVTSPEDDRILHMSSPSLSYSEMSS